MPNPWPNVPLKRVLKAVLRPESVDPMKEYRSLGVRLDGGGPFLRETKPGSQIASKTLFRVKGGDFIYSRLFAWRGAFGVVPGEFDSCYVSGEFPTFQPTAGCIDVEFLRLWFRLPATLTTVEAHCTGSTPLTRNRFKEEFFSALEIPLPPLHEQRRIVARIEQLAAKIQEARHVQLGTELELQHLLHGAYSKISADAPLRRMAGVAPLVRRPVEVNLENQYLELGIRSFGKGTFHKTPATGAALGSKRIFNVEPGDLLFNIVFAWEGAVAVAKKEDDGRVGSHRFLTCVPKQCVATAGYLCFHFLTDKGLDDLGRASPGGAGRNRTLGLEALAAVEVPVPSYDKQLWFDALQAKVDALKKLQAETAAELDALMPSILDRAFRGEL